MKPSRLHRDNKTEVFPEVNTPKLVKLWSKGVRLELNLAMCSVCITGFEGMRVQRELLRLGISWQGQSTTSETLRVY